MYSRSSYTYTTVSVSKSNSHRLHYHSPDIPPDRCQAVSQSPVPLLRPCGQHSRRYRCRHYRSYCYSHVPAHLRTPTLLATTAPRRPLRSCSHPMGLRASPSSRSALCAWSGVLRTPASLWTHLRCPLSTVSFPSHPSRTCQTARTASCSRRRALSSPTCATHNTTPPEVQPLVPLRWPRLQVHIRAWVRVSLAGSGCPPLTLPAASDRRTTPKGCRTSRRRSAAPPALRIRSVTASSLWRRGGSPAAGLPIAGRCSAGLGRSATPAGSYMRRLRLSSPGTSRPSSSCRRRCLRQRLTGRQA